jgi:ethanolamine utilization protein EutP (predicted NTPase)
LQRLADAADADVLIGEPVGSCTDLSATVMQPLKKLHGERFEVAPFSVLVDVKQVRTLARLRAAIPSDQATRFPDNVLYIYEKQLEEADVIVLNKIDMISAAELKALKASLAERFPDVPLLPMSASTGEGVDAWLEFLDRGQVVGGKIAEVNYDTYAAGEAALGWMNASATLQAADSVDWKTFAGELLEAIRRGLQLQSAEIAHLKVHLASSGGSLVGNITSSDGPLAVRGQIEPGQRRTALLINARVHAAPELLQSVVENALTATGGGRVSASVTNLRSFHPGRPQPTYRYEEVV